MTTLKLTRKLNINQILHLCKLCVFGAFVQKRKIADNHL